jgi:hypothetical protein
MPINWTNSAAACQLTGLILLQHANLPGLILLQHANFRQKHTFNTWPTPKNDDKIQEQSMPMSMSISIGWPKNSGN